MVSSATPLEVTEEEVEVLDVLEEGLDGKGIGILFYCKWNEDREDFPEEFLDYINQLDDGGHIDYGRVLKSDVSDLDELTMLKKVSNYSQAVNNALFDIPIKPPFYYMAVPLLNRPYAQEICDIIKRSFDLDSIFFSYPA